ncbi:C40 family peptidase [Cellulomonas aerilata]|uniref:C40 family peptidase n=1 Tax=Cellulomonas aerilata TaxID=515326 RepID=UPI0027D95CD9|nr:C40 family peptidase [Cellulomonas aerilata]
MSTTRARHRAARRPATPLTDLATAATGSIAVVGRRTAIAAASAGLVVSTIAAPAGAAGAPASAPSSLPAVDTSALTAAARAALATAPVVTVAADAQFALDVPAVTVVKDPPPPPPVVKKVAAKPTRTAAVASRSAERVAAPAADESATEAEAVTESVVEEAPAASVPASASGSAIAEIATRYVGVPYRSGGTTPDGFDCSGFTSYVFAQVGISLPRTSGAQRGAGTVVSRSEARAGDLIWSPGHISIYLGDGMQVDAPRPGKSIQVRSLWQSSPVFIRVA